MAQLRRVLGPLHTEELATLGELHEIAMGGPRSPFSTTAYADEVDWLRGVALAEPAGMPRPESWLLGTPAGAALLELAAGDTAEFGQAGSTLEAMAAITTAVAVAGKLSRDQLNTIGSPFAGLLPGLAAEIASSAAA
jgi:hypothetical protein